MIKSAIAILKKDATIEIRNKTSILALALFGVICAFSFAFGLSGEKLNSQVFASLILSSIALSAMIGLDKSFIYEEERGSFLLLTVYGDSYAVFLGKLVFNFLLSLFLSLFSLFAFEAGFDFQFKANFILLLLSAIASSMAFASASTIISALIAKSKAKGTIFPVLIFPIILPALIASFWAFQATFSDDGKAISNIILLIAYSGAISSISIYLFDLIWKD